MRRPHLLRGAKRSSVPRRHLFVDTETDQEEAVEGAVGHVLRFGTAIYGEWLSDGTWSRVRRCRFTSIAEFWDFVEGCTNQKAEVWVWCHNSNFDYPVLDAFREPMRRGWTLKSAIIDGPPTIARLAKGSAKLKLVDTLNIWREPLKRLGDSIGLPKLDMPPQDAPSEAWDTYAWRDVEIIMEAVRSWISFIRTNDLGIFRPTVASQALATYTHRFMPCPILIDDDEEATALARACYFGGRTEAFFLGRVPDQTHGTDFNSMYPDRMAKCEMPVQKLGLYKRVTLEEVGKWVKKRAVCAHVIIKTDAPAYGVIRDGRLVFPVGEFEAHLSTPELSHALKMGHLVAINRAVVYKKAAIFRDFIHYCYVERLKAKARGDKVASDHWKKLMNSLYGKFGQTGRVYEPVTQTDDLSPGAWDEVDAETGEVTHYRQLGGLKLSYINEAESLDSMPAIAAHVTAEARMKLWRHIVTAGRENVRYCDTDSIWTNDAGLERLRGRLHDTKLGRLKLEWSSSEVEIRGLKDYTIGDKTKIKGVRGSATWLDANTVQQERWSGLKGQLRSGDLSRPTTAKMIKHLSREYTKGTVQPSGLVEPFVLSL